MKAFRIVGARILPFGGTPDVVANSDLWLRDGKVAAICPAGSPAPFDEPYETYSYRNAVVLPGLVNAHSHSASALQRGRIAGAPLDLFVMEAMSRRSPRTARHVRVAALLHAVEMLKHGITGVIDHLRHGAVPSVEAVCAAMQAYEDIGMRAAVAPMFEDKRYIESLPIDPERLPPAVRDRWRGMTPPRAEDYFAMMEEVIAEARGRKGVRAMLGIDGPQRCSTRLLEMAGDFAARHGVGLHTHLLEAKTQALMAPADYGGSFVAYLDRFGLVGPKSSLAHFVWCTDRDIALAAEKRVTVVNNPVSNLALGSGIQPTARLLERGVTVALGSDGCSTNGINLFEQAKISMLLSRVSQVDCDRWIMAPRALRMAVEGGAAALAEPDVPGAVAVGAAADLAILDLDSAAHRPLGDIWNHLVMYENGDAVDSVFVNGEPVLRRGRCTRINEDDVYAEAAELAELDDAKNEQFLNVTRGERAAFQPLLVEALEREIEINRFGRLS